MSSGMKIDRLPVSCNKDCGAGCPLLAHVENGRLVKITDNPHAGPYMRGCDRGYQMPRVAYAQDRLKRPLLRDGPRGSGQFKEIEWPEALDRVATRLMEIKKKSGCGAILGLSGSGACRGVFHNTSVQTISKVVPRGQFHLPRFSLPRRLRTERYLIENRHKHHQ